MMKSVRFRRAFRLMCAVGILEGAFYFFEMLNAGDRLGGGAATGHAYVTQRVFGLIIFVGTRNGYYSNLSSVAWVVPILLAIPLIIGLVAYTVGWQSRQGRHNIPQADG